MRRLVLNWLASNMIQERVRPFFSRRDVKEVLITGGLCFVYLLSIPLHELGHMIAFWTLGFDSKIVFRPDMIATSPILSDSNAWLLYYDSLVYHSLMGGLFSAIATLPFCKINLRYSFVSFYQLGCGLAEPIMNQLRISGSLTVPIMGCISVLLLLFSFGMMFAILYADLKFKEVKR